MIPEAPAKAPRKGRVAVTALGLAWAEAEPLVAVALHDNARRRRDVLVVLSDASPAWLSQADVPVELMPTRQALKALDDAEWQIWVLRRWEILLAKWDIRSNIVLGVSFEAFVASQLRANKVSD